MTAFPSTEEEEEEEERKRKKKRRRKERKKKKERKKEIMSPIRMGSFLISTINLSILVF